MYSLSQLATSISVFLIECDVAKFSLINMISHHHFFNEPGTTSFWFGMF